MGFRRSGVVRTTYGQFEIMVDFLEQHPEMNGIAHETKAGRRKLWNTLTDLLNHNGPPVRKSVEWKSIWADYKYNLKKKLRTDSTCSKRQAGKRILFSSIETKAINMLKLTDKVCGRNYKIHQKPSHETMPRGRITRPRRELKTEVKQQEPEVSGEEEIEESIVICSDLESESRGKSELVTDEREIDLPLDSGEQMNTESMNCDVTLTLKDTLHGMQRTQLEILKELKEYNRQKRDSHYFKELHLQLEREKFAEQKQQNLEANKRASLELDLKRKQLELYELKLRRACTDCVVKTESYEYVVSNLN